MFEPKAPGIIILAQVTFLLCPLALFVSATVAYAIFSDCRDSATEMFEREQQNYGSFAYSGTTPTGQQLLRAVPQQSAPPPAPLPFQGEGKRLGAALAASEKREEK